MNSQQRKYALERVSAIASAKLNALNAAFNAAERKLTDEQKYALIVNKKVKLKAVLPALVWSTRAFDIFEFGKLLGHTDQEKQKYAEDRAQIEAKSLNIKDRIMLGDAEGALALLEEFAA